MINPTLPKKRRGVYYHPSYRLPVRKARICLGCDKEFISEGPGNRFCARCTVKNKNQPPGRVPVRMVFSEPEHSFYQSLMGG